MASPQYWEYKWAHLSIKNTHGLGKVMSLHNASFAAVQSRQHRVGRDLQRKMRNQLGVLNHIIVDSNSCLMLSSIGDTWCLNALISWLLERCCLFPCGQGHGTNRRLSREERNSYQEKLTILAIFCLYVDYDWHLMNITKILQEQRLQLPKWSRIGQGSCGRAEERQSGPPGHVHHFLVGHYYLVSHLDMFTIFCKYNFT